MGAAAWTVIGVVFVVLPACWYFLRTAIARERRRAGDTPSGVSTTVARHDARRNRAAESACAIEAISKLSALADKGMLSHADFQKKKHELLSHI